MSRTQIKEKTIKALSKADLTDSAHSKTKSSQVFQTPKVAKKITSDKGLSKELIALRRSMKSHTKSILSSEEKTTEWMIKIGYLTRKGTISPRYK